MSQTRSESNDSETVKDVNKKNSPMHIKKTRSILDRNSFESDEEIEVTVDENELTPQVTTASSAPKAMEVFTSLAYCSENQTLCAGTNQGNLYIWKRNVTASTPRTNGYVAVLVYNALNHFIFITNFVRFENGFESMENCWHLVNIASVRGAIKHCSWGVCDVSTPCVLVNCISNVYILKV